MYAEHPQLLLELWCLLNKPHLIFLRLQKSHTEHICDHDFSFWCLFSALGYFILGAQDNI